MDKPLCELCGEPMPPGEEMFKIHGYSGNCPKPPKPKATPQEPTEDELDAAFEEWMKARRTVKVKVGLWEAFKAGSDWRAKLSPNATQEPCQHGKVPPCCGIRPDGQ